MGLRMGQTGAKNDQAGSREFVIFRVGRREEEGALGRPWPLNGVSDFLRPGDQDWRVGTE